MSTPEELALAEAEAQARYADRWASFTLKQRTILTQQYADRRAAQAGQPWVTAYLGAPTQEWSDEARIWVRSRPRAVQEMMLRFPPGCLVRTVPGAELIVPAPGTVGIVVSYSDDGYVCVIQGPTTGVRAACAADELELAGCPAGQSPDDVRAVLGWGTN